MANIKKITHLWNTTGLTLYCIIRRDADGYLLNDADGVFASSPADPYISLAEDAVIKGMYELSESRAAWNNGDYSVVVYRQTGASPAPAIDIIIGGGIMEIRSDLEIVNVNVESSDDKTGYALSVAPPTKEEIATQVETQVISETDGNLVLKAITDKIASVNPTLGELSLSAIASAVATALLITPANKISTDADNAVKIQKMAVTLDSGDVTGNLPAQVKAQDNIDFGALQKASITAAVPSAATIQSGLALDSTVMKAASYTAPPTASAIATAVHDAVIEGTLKFKNIIKILLSVLAGKSSGGGTATITFRDVADEKNRVSATVDTNGNRLSITLDGD